MGVNKERDFAFCLCAVVFILWFVYGGLSIAFFRVHGFKNDGRCL